MVEEHLHNRTTIFNLDVLWTLQFCSFYSSFRVGFLSLILFFLLYFNTLHLGFHPALCIMCLFIFINIFISNLVLRTSNLLCGDYSNEYWLVQTAPMVPKNNTKKFILNLSKTYLIGFSASNTFSFSPESIQNHPDTIHKWKIFKSKLKLYSHINWILKFPKFKNLPKKIQKFAKFKIFPIKTQKSPTLSPYVNVVGH